VKTYGVVVGRFQTSELHRGHLDFLKKVERETDGLIVLLGVTPALGTDRDPLDFKSRLLMIKESFPKARVEEVLDQSSDARWSYLLDQKVAALVGKNKAILYGSKHNFFSHYHGKISTREIAAVFPGSHAKDVRKAIGKDPLFTDEFRRGVIYASQQQYPRAFPCVDIACTRDKGAARKVLLGRRFPGDKLRFPGGFVDPTDESLEMAASRELMEEAPGISVSGVLDGAFKYIGSYRIDDWRYRDTKDRIVTTFFHVEYMFGGTIAGDDLCEVDWYSFTEEVKDQLVPNHQMLFEELASFLGKSIKPKRRAARV